MSEAERDITQLLGEIGSGSSTAKQQLLDRAYDALRGLAGGMMRRERPEHTLQPTALVNEAAMRMMGQLGDLAGRDRAYFFGAMATAMRRVLVDHARSKKAARRGGGEYQRHGLDYAIDFVEQDAKINLLDLNEALERLADLNERQSEVVTLRFFGGLSIPEIAEHLEVSVSTVEKDWRFARAWLQTQLGEDGK